MAACHALHIALHAAWQRSCSGLRSPRTRDRVASRHPGDSNRLDATLDHRTIREPYQPVAGGDRRMSTDVAALLAKLKGLNGKFPSKAPAEFQKDYADFVKKADFYLVVLKRFADDGPSAKELADYSSQKQALAKLKDQINASVKEQKNDQKDVDGVLHDVMSMNQQLQKKLDGKKEAADLAKAVQAFSAAAAQAGVPESSSPVD
jgi:hypothetical protein